MELRYTPTVGNTLIIDDIDYTEEQVRLLIKCAESLFCANAMADEANGGGNGMDWEWIDDSFGYANRALPETTKAALIVEARANNDFDEDDSDEANHPEAEGGPDAELGASFRNL